jgi:hypothetical protein
MSSGGDRLTTKITKGTVVGGQRSEVRGTKKLANPTSFILPPSLVLCVPRVLCGIPCPFSHVSPASSFPRSSFRNLSVRIAGQKNRAHESFRPNPRRTNGLRRCVLSYARQAVRARARTNPDDEKDGKSEIGGRMSEAGRMKLAGAQQILPVFPRNPFFCSLFVCRKPDRISPRRLRAKRVPIAENPLMYINMHNIPYKKQAADAAAAPVR